MRLQQSGEFLEQFVARGMAAGVVDHLELVKVHEAYDVVLARFQGARHRNLEQTFEFTPIGQSRQRIVRGFPGALARKAAHGGHIAEYHHAPADLAVRVVDRGGAVVDPHLAAVPPDQVDVLPEGDDAVLGQGLAQRVRNRIPRRCVDQMQDFRDGPACGLTASPAGELFRRRVQKGDAGGGVRGDHAVANRMQRDLGALHLLEQSVRNLPQRAQREHPQRDEYRAPEQKPEHGRNAGSVQYPAQ